MQVRKLIRILNEMVKKDPSLKYKEVCVDNRYGANNVTEWTYSPIHDVETHWCVWENDNPDTEIQREVVVLGNL